MCVCASHHRVWFKHRSNHFIPAYAQGLAMGLAQIPLSIVEATLFSLIMYFMVRHAPCTHWHMQTHTGKQRCTHGPGQVLVSITRAMRFPLIMYLMVRMTHTHTHTRTHITHTHTDGLTDGRTNTVCASTHFDVCRDSRYGQAEDLRSKGLCRHACIIARGVSRWVCT